MFKLIVGLANFKIEYLRTRHNVGAWYIEKLMAYNDQFSLKKVDKFNGYIGNLTFYNSNIRLLIPSTYMNMSGISVLAVTQFYHFIPNDILIVHDDLDLSPGNVRIKFSGTHNGHNGVKDVIAKLKSNHFYRLRIGIGRPAKKSLIKKFVLSEPSSEEKKKFVKLSINQ